MTKNSTCYDSCFYQYRNPKKCSYDDNFHPCRSGLQCLYHQHGEGEIPETPEFPRIAEPSSPELKFHPNSAHS